MLYAMTMSNAMARFSRWFDDMASQGMDVRKMAHLKTKHEAQELYEAVNAWDVVIAAQPMVDNSGLRRLVAEETVDVIMSAVAAAQHCGITVRELADFVYAKADKNERRSWALNPDGTYSHT